MSDRQDVFTETVEEQPAGILDVVVGSAEALGSAVAHTAQAGYHYASEQYHIHAAVDATENRDMDGMQNHLDEAFADHYNHLDELNAAREAVGLEPNMDDDGA